VGRQNGRKNKKPKTLKKGIARSYGAKSPLLTACGVFNPTACTFENPAFQSLRQMFNRR
jgi:hypothetical protein